MSGGDIQPGIQMSLLFDDTTITEARLHQYLSYTGVSETCEVGDVTNWASDSLLFAGISMTTYPYKNYSQLLASPYTATDWTIRYNQYPGAKRITVYNHCVVLVAASESVTSGQGVMLSDVADASTDRHDGMLSVNDGSTAGQLHGTIGIARTNATVGTHAGHTFDAEGFSTLHPSFEALLWR